MNHDPRRHDASRTDEAGAGGTAEGADSPLVLGHPGETDPWVGEDPESVLDAWIAHEVLTPVPLAAREDLQAWGRRLVRLDEEPEPWKDPGQARAGAETAVHWLLHLGEVDLERATRELLQRFADDSTAAAERRRKVQGVVPLAVVVLDEAGVLLEGQVAVASFPWGIGRVCQGHLRRLAAFAEAERELQELIGHLLTRTDRDGKALPVGDGLVDTVVSQLVEELGLPPDLLVSSGLAIRVPTRKKRPQAPEPDLLNSFFLEDLVRVRREYDEGAGPAIRAYFAGVPERPRRDVRREPAVLEETVAPSRLPAARWPIRGGHSLVLMQQAAVNRAAADLAQGGLLGVNGPPGTGKTTLLRDIVARVVLERAEALVEFEEPEEAFSHVAPMRLGRGFAHLYRLDETLLGHEIVVASSNNKAVENVSRELPAADAVAGSVLESGGYFRSIADCVAAGGRDEDLVEGVSWGLAAAVLGNRANRREFTEAFWWHRKRGMFAYLRTVIEGWDPEAEGPIDVGAGAPEVAWLEGAPRDLAEARERWEAAREAFDRRRKAVRELLDILEAGRVASNRRSELQTRLQMLDELRAAGGPDRRAAGRAMEEAAAQLERARRAEEEQEQRRRDHRLLRPGLVAWLFGTARHREWAERWRSILEELDRRRTARRRAEEDHERARSIVQALEEERERLEADRREAAERLARAEHTVRRARAIAGEQMPEAGWWATRQDAVQTRSPWLGSPLQRARDELFVAAFQLHRAFVDAAARKMRHNLAVVLNVMQGRSLSRRQEPARRSLWASLCLVVPVLSTTFASVGRLFGPLGREQIGWLLVDEAGQALPQAAVGALWRSRRAVFIGDPLQIEPVVPAPPRLLDRLYEQFGVVPDLWAAPGISAQTLADRASWFGTRILRDDGDLWVGSPLRVHRRCEDPMFTISNRIAYDGFMVSATPSRPSPIGAVLGDSRWIDVQGRADGKWSPEEGEVALGMLRTVLDAGLGDPDLFLITPFRIVSFNLRNTVRSARPLADRLPSSPGRWTRDRIGTVHTFQGKEAEAVVLVLGAPGEESAGARSWAGSSPNLLNVAVSRAKRRLYVVGSHEAWREVGVFRILARSLPVERSG